MTNLLDDLNNELWEEGWTMANHEAFQEIKNDQ